MACPIIREKEKPGSIVYTDCYKDFDWELLESGKGRFGLYVQGCEWRFDKSEIKVRIPIAKQLVKYDLPRLSRMVL